MWSVRPEVRSGLIWVVWSIWVDLGGLVDLGCSGLIWVDPGGLVDLG